MPAWRPWGRVRAPLPPVQEPGVDHPSVGPLWDAVDLYRLFALLYAVYEFAGRLPAVARPALGWAVLAVLAGWTVAMLVDRRRTTAQLWIELALATAAILATIWVDDPAIRQTGVSTVPGIWAGAIVLAAGVGRGPLAATGAWAVIVVADLLEIGTPTEGTLHNVFLLLIMATCAALAAGAARRGDEAFLAGVRLKAQVAERERLARTVHDGVLQALALIHRRGAELGGPARELGDLAGLQERRLRDLVSTRPRLRADDGRCDLTAAVRATAARHGELAQVAAPVEPVAGDCSRVGELAAAVGAALDNVAAHAGPGARAWILIEDDTDEVTVTVRDDGIGTTPERLAQAERDGRLGVAASIVGRLRDLGGLATCRTAPGAGTAWELTMPLVLPGPGGPERHTGQR